MLENIEGAIKNRQSRETDNTGYTRRRNTKQKHNTIYIGHHYVYICFICCIIQGTYDGVPRSARQALQSSIVALIFSSHPVISVLCDLTVSLIFATISNKISFLASISTSTNRCLEMINDLN